MWFVFAIAAVFFFGLRGIMYHWTSRKMIDRNLLLFGVYLTGVLLASVVNLVWGEPWTKSTAVGILMGFFSFLANAAMYKGFAVGKTSVVALLTGLPSLVVVVLAYFFWGESLSLNQLLAFCVVIVGIVMIRYSVDLRLGQLQGIQYGLLAMLFFAFTDLLTKQSTLLGASALPTLIVMYGTGAVLFGASWFKEQLKARKMMLAHVAEREVAAGSESPKANAAVWSRSRIVGWGMIVGLTNVAGMFLLIYAMRDGVTGIVSAVAALSILFVLLYSRFYLKEHMSRREQLGIVVALIGVFGLRLFS